MRENHIGKELFIPGAVFQLVRMNEVHRRDALRNSLMGSKEVRLVPVHRNDFVGVRGRSAACSSVTRRAVTETRSAPCCVVWARVGGEKGGIRVALSERLRESQYGITAEWKMWKGRVAVVIGGGIDIGSTGSSRRYIRMASSNGRLALREKRHE